MLDKISSNNNQSLDSLADPTVILIFNYLPFQALINLAVTSKKFLRLSKEKSVWKNKLHELWSLERAEKIIAEPQMAWLVFQSSEVFKQWFENFSLKKMALASSELAQFIAQHETLARQLTHESLIEIAQVNPKSLQYILEKVKFSDEKGIDRLTEIAMADFRMVEFILQTPKYADQLRASDLEKIILDRLVSAAFQRIQLVFQNKTLVNKLDLSQLIAIAKSGLQYAQLVFQNSEAVNMFNVSLRKSSALRQVVAINPGAMQFILQNSEIAEKLLDSDIEEMAAAHPHVILFIFQNVKFADRLEKKWLFKIFDQSPELAQLVFQNSKLVGKLDGNELEKIIILFPLLGPIIFQSTELSNKLRMWKLVCAYPEYVFQYAGLASRLSSNELSVIAKKNPYLAFDIVKNPELNSQLTAMGLTTIALSNLKAAQFILENTDLASKLTVENLEDIFVNPFLMDKLNKQQLLIRANLHVVKFILGTSKLNHKFYDHLDLIMNLAKKHPELRQCIEQKNDSLIWRIKQREREWERLKKAVEGTTNYLQENFVMCKQHALITLGIFKSVANYCFPSNAEANNDLPQNTL